MACWLFKEEPDHYNFADLERDGTTLWDGVTNNLARLNLRKVRAGDRIFYYHTGKEKAVVGEMKAVSGPLADHADPKAVAVRVRAVRRLPRPVPLSRIKDEPTLADWDLVRISRLSVVPVTPAQWRRVKDLSREAAD
jgi:predicted RNA-binding protein with PUA-like domain